MIRLLGFLVGSAVSIGILLLILGVPDIQLSKSVIEDIDLDSVPHIVDAVRTDIEVVANEVIDEVSEIVDQLETEEPPAEQAAKIETDEAESPPVLPTYEEPGADIDSAPDALVENDLKWHSFWNPFRSEIAATGFVTQLEKVTGLDYRVVKIKAGVYEVTFAYENDSERRTKLTQITSATGLDLPDS